jgi:hypothetical protein
VSLPSLAAAPSLSSARRCSQHAYCQPLPNHLDNYPFLYM